MNKNPKIDHAAQWTADYVNSNRYALKTKGIKPDDLYKQYAATTPFPMGWKSLAPMLHMVGLAKIYHNGEYLYVLMQDLAIV